MHAAACMLIDCIIEPECMLIDRIIELSNA